MHNKLSQWAVPKVSKGAGVCMAPIIDAHIKRDGTWHFYIQSQSSSCTQRCMRKARYTNEIAKDCPRYCDCIAFCCFCIPKTKYSITPRNQPPIFTISTAKRLGSTASSSRWVGKCYLQEYHCMLRPRDSLDCMNRSSPCS